MQDYITDFAKAELADLTDSVELANEGSRFKVNFDYHLGFYITAQVGAYTLNYGASIDGDGTTVAWLSDESDFYEEIARYDEQTFNNLDKAYELAFAKYGN